jgi:predicted SAM-dependent methyltransferase
MRSALLFLFSHRFLAIARWDLHFLKVRFVNLLRNQKRRAAAFAVGRAHPALLNLGAGPRGRNDGHWVNVDGFANRKVHFVIDFRRPLPFPSGCFDGAFSEHVLEHFTSEDGLVLLQEILRVLRPGGVFRVIVPDAEFVVRSYADDPESLVDYRGEGSGTAMEMVNSFFRQRYEHQFMYDWQTLEHLLYAAGFSQVRRMAFGESAMGELGIDDPKYARESLYVEARKS